MTVLVLDTCEIHKSFQLDGPIIATFTDFCRDFGCRLVLPEVVIEEHVADFRDDLESTAANARRYEKLSGIGAAGPRPPLESVDDLTGRYRDFVRSWVQLHGEVAAVPEGHSAEILHKLVGRKKPFKPDRTGYADSLIWLTVLDRAKLGHEVLFVSSNTGDFGQEGGLHPDLLEEMDQAGVERSGVKFFGGFKKFEAMHVRPAREQLARRAQLDAIAEAMLGYDWAPVSIAGWIEQHFEELNPGWHFTGWDIGVPYEFDDAEYADFEALRELTDVDVSDAGNGCLLIQVVASVSVRYYANADIEDIYDAYGDAVAEVLDEEEYDHHHRTYRGNIRATLDCQARIALRVVEDTGEVQSSELVGLYDDGSILASSTAPPE